MRNFLFILAPFLITFFPVFADPVVEDEDFFAEKFVEGLSRPTSLHFIENDLLVLEKDGNVRLIRNGTLQNESILNVSVNTTNERGLLGITSINSTVFLYFTESDLESGDLLGNRIYRYNWNGTNLVNSVLIHDLPVNFTIPQHNGGTMVTGLDDTIYAVIGDAKHKGILQNYKEGKFDDTSVILYVDQSGLTIKPSLSENPQDFYHAIGIRNSFGLAIDPITGTLWDTENGPAYFDEINLVEPKFNSGYKIAMGPATSDEKNLLEEKHGYFYSDPEFSWETPVGPTGITFVDSDLFEKYEDFILVGDIHTGTIWKFKLNKERSGLIFEDPQLEDLILNRTEFSDEIVFAKGFLGITDLAFGPDGFLYVTSFGDGIIYRILPSNFLIEESDFPQWFKQNVSWWKNNQINDKTFFQSMKYLIEHHVIILSTIPDLNKQTEPLVELFKQNATSWEINRISDQDFKKSIEISIENGLIELDRDKIRCNSFPQERIDLSNCNLMGKDFSNLVILQANLRNSDLSNSNFFSADLRYTDFRNSILINANLENANLLGSNLADTDLTGAQLSNANLQFTILNNANLEKANLTGVNLRGSILQNADLTGANLQGADLTGAYLVDAQIRNANFDEAITYGCSGCP